MQPIRVRAHRRAHDMVFDLPVFAGPTRPTVLVTLGTVFSDPQVLAATVESVATCGVNVIATLGSSIRSPPTGTGDQWPTDSPPGGGAEVRYVPFVPLDQLLGAADLVVGVGGAGTVLGALAHAVPMVLWPQGADRPVNASRAQAGGVAITGDSAEAISAAVRQALAGDTYRRRAQEAATQIASRADPADIVKHITTG